MLIRLLSGFTRRARGNLAIICIIATATGQPSDVTNSVFSSFCSSLVVFQPSHNTKRETRDSSALSRYKNAAGGRESGKMLFTQFFFMQMRDILSHENQYFCFKSSPRLNIEIFTLRMELKQRMKSNCH